MNSVRSLSSAWPVGGERDATTRARRLAWLNRYGAVLAVYALATWWLNPHFMGDTIGYADEILSGRLWEFGHLLWRPLGWLTWQLFGPMTRLIMGADDRTHIVVILMAINWLAGLVSVLSIHALVSRFAARPWIAYSVTTGFIFSQGFLDLAQTGCAYVPGLSLVLLSLWLLSRDSAGPGVSRAALLAGAALGGAVTLWFPYILAVPAVVAFPLSIDSNRGRWQRALQAGVSCVFTISVVYGSVAASLGIDTVPGFLAWMHASTHSVTDIGGVPRMIFGFARSFINMGQDGILFKRFLLHDPYSPVTVWDLLLVSLWKFLLFYLLIISMTVNLLRSAHGIRAFGFLALNAVPVIVFGALWQGGDIERYLPLYGGIFFSLTVALSVSRPVLWLRALTLIFLLTVMISSAHAMSKPVLERRQALAVERIRDLLPLLKPASLVITTHQQDDIWAFSWTFPLHPINRSGRLVAFDLISTGTANVPIWREGFARYVLGSWGVGGDVWVSKRLLHSRPRPEWNWVEGADPRVSWADLSPFFSQLEFGQSVGGDDGFLFLLPSEKNRELLASFGELSSSSQD